MARLEGTPLDRSDDTYRALSGLQALLQAFSADMAPAFRADTLAFFSGLLGQLHELRWVMPAPRGPISMQILCPLHC